MMCSMTNHHPPPPGWRPAQPPSHLNDTHGWRTYVVATLEHILIRLHYIEHQASRSDTPAPDAPTISPPAKETIWRDRKELAQEVTSMAKAISTGLMWLAVIVLGVGLIMKRIDSSHLQMLKFWSGTPG